MTFVMNTAFASLTWYNIIKTVSDRSSPPTSCNKQYATLVAKATLRIAGRGHRVIQSVRLFNDINYHFKSLHYKSKGKSLKPRKNNLSQP